MNEAPSSAVHESIPLLKLVGEGGRRLVLRRGKELLSIFKVPVGFGDHLQHAMGEFFSLFPWVLKYASENLCWELQKFFVWANYIRKEKYLSIEPPRLSYGERYLSYIGIHDLLVVVCIKPYFPSNGRWIESFSSQRKISAGYPLCTCLARGTFYHACQRKSMLSNWLKRAHICGTSHNSNYLTLYDFASNSSTIPSTELDKVFNAIVCAITEENSSIHSQVHKLAYMLGVLYNVCSSSHLQAVASADEYTYFCTNYKDLSYRAAQIATQLCIREQLPSYDKTSYVDKIVYILLFKTLSDASLLFYFSKFNREVQLYLTDLELKSIERIKRWAHKLTENNNNREK